MPAARYSAAGIQMRQGDHSPEGHFFFAAGFAGAFEAALLAGALAAGAALAGDFAAVFAAGAAAALGVTAGFAAGATAGFSALAAAGLASAFGATAFAIDVLASGMTVASGMGVGGATFTGAGAGDEIVGGPAVGRPALLTGVAGSESASARLASGVTLAAFGFPSGALPGGGSIGLRFEAYSATSSSKPCASSVDIRARRRK